MGEIFLYIASTLFLPILLLILFLEKRARRILLSLLCGVIVCLIAYFSSTLFISAGLITSNKYSLFFSPVIEEILKFIPLLIFSFAFKKGIRQTIAISFALGVGFCVVENLYYLFSNAHNVGIFWVIARCIGAGLMHSITATLIGIGIYMGRTKKKTVLIGLSSLIIAILYHGLYNFLVANQSTQFIGICVPIISIICLLAFHKKDRIKAFFEDVDNEDITLQKSKEK